MYVKLNILCSYITRKSNVDSSYIDILLQIALVPRITVARRGPFGSISQYKYFYTFNALKPNKNK